MHGRTDGHANLQFELVIWMFKDDSDFFYGRIPKEGAMLKKVI